MSKKVFLLCMIILIGYFLTKKRSTTSVSKVTQVINIANSFNGIGYKAGGTTKSGMDCSGLVYISFKKVYVHLPRSSQQMSAKGETIHKDEIQQGDLLFFNIDRLKGVINHVGLVVSIDDEDVRFIHSTTSKGVIITSLNESYWENAFVKAKRVLQ